MARGLKYLSEVMESKEFVNRLRDRARDTIDAYDILHHYGAENIQQKSKNGEIVHSCLIDRVIPHHKNGDANPTASINEESLLYGCWSMGGGDVVWLVETMEGSREAAAKVLSKLSSGESTKSFLEQIDKMFQSGDVLTIPSYNHVILDHWLMIHPYWLDRGLSEETVMKARLGYDEKDIRVTIPHFWKGKLVGWQKRRLDDPRYPQTAPGEPKYKNSPSFPKNETLYAYDWANKKEPVVLFEGVAECLMAMQRGYNAVSSFSAWITKKQIEHLRVFPKVTVFFDYDDAGLKGSARVLKHLSPYTTVEVVFSESEKDFDTMTEEEADSLLSHAEDSIFSWIKLEAMGFKG